MFKELKEYVECMNKDQETIKRHTKIIKFLLFNFNN